MKKFLMSFVALFFMVGLAMADSPKVEGRIKSVDLIKSTFTIVDVENEEYSFALVPSTEVEFKDKLIEDGTTKDLKIGQWVKVEYKAGKKMNTAREVKIYKEAKK